MRTIVIIQARMGSSRLPGKVLMPLGEHCELDYVVTRCRIIRGIDEVIVATSTLPGDDPIEAWCRSNSVACFRGSEDDVLSRYYECALAYSPEYVIRVTADCPFIDYELAGRIVEAMYQEPADLVVLNGSLPRGLSVEMFAFKSLERIHEIGREHRHREHVTFYAYEFPDQFRAVSVDVPEELRYPELRITLDTPEDYALLQAIAQAFPGRRDISSSVVVRYLVDHPEVAVLNAHIEQKPVI